MKNSHQGTPNSLYFISGSLSAIVFFYTINTIFIMSATGSVSFLIMRLSSISNSNGLMTITSIGLLLLVISSIFLGSYIVQYLYLRKKKTSLKPIFFIFIIVSIFLFISIFLFNYKLNILNILKNKQLNINIFLSSMLSFSSFIIGMVWMLLDGTTAMSNAVKELILHSSGASNKNYKSFLGLIGFVITGIAYYGMYEYSINSNYINKMAFSILLFINMILIIILIFDTFCVRNNGFKLLKNLEKNCLTIPEINYKYTYIKNISIALLALLTGIAIATSTSQDYSNSLPSSRNDNAGFTSKQKYNSISHISSNKK